MFRAAHLARLPLLAALGLAGCGGGVFLGFGFGDDHFDGSGPSVSLATPSSTAAAGSTVALVAAASDEHGVDSVAFYQLDDANGATLLGADGSAPYQWNAVVPSAASVRYFARATDGLGNRADSAVVTVTIVP